MSRVLTERKPTNAEIKAAQREMAAALAEKSTTHVECRAMRHAWKQKNVIRLINPTTKRDLPVLVLDLACIRGCDVVRHDTMVVRKSAKPGEYTLVERLPPRYTYPEAYTIPGVPRGARASDIIWQDFIRRSAETIAQAEPGQRGTSD